MSVDICLLITITKYNNKYLERRSQNSGTPVFHLSPFIFILQVRCQCDHAGQDLSDPSYLVRQLGQTVSEEKFPVKFVTASADQLLQLQDVCGGAESGGNHEGEQQLLRPAYQLGEQGVDFLR